jgi:hypothetical protein
MVVPCDWLPQTFAAAVELAAGANGSRSDGDRLGLRNLALFIDTYERLEPLDSWLRQQYLPSLPAHTIIAIASRQLPSVEWRTDPGWAAVLEVLPLRNFRPEESRAYLTSRGFPEPQHNEVLGFTHGNPLALSLLTELYRLQPERFTVRHPDVIQELVRGCSMMSQRRCIAQRSRCAPISESRQKIGSPTLS